MNIWHDMKTRWDKTLTSQPRWDGNRLTFFINIEGRRIPCAISRSALQNLSGHTYLATSELLGLFMDSRGKIEEIAARIFHITPEWVSGPVSIWAAISTIRRRLMHFALRELVPFTIDGAAAAGSRAFQAGRRSTQRVTATMGTQQVILVG
jgi:Protein of unknown function (DUF1488)